jgi:hypothetical protein
MHAVCLLKGKEGEAALRQLCTWEHSLQLCESVVMLLLLLLLLLLLWAGK